MNNIPPYEEFLIDIKQIFADGDLRAGYVMLRNLIRDEKLPNGDDYTYKFILGKFRSLHDQWNYRYALMEERNFLPKTAREERDTFEEFISKARYNEEFTINKGNRDRDNYLFAGFPQSELSKQRIEFEKTWRRDLKKENEKEAQ